MLLCINYRQTLPNACVTCKTVPCVILRVSWWWCVQTKQRVLQDKLDLGSYLLKPVQRMGKYALLLKQIIKDVPDTEPEHGNIQVSIWICQFLFYGLLVVTVNWMLLTSSVGYWCVLCNTIFSLAIMQFQAALDMMRFYLRHGNDLLAMDSILNSDVSNILGQYD